MAEELGWGTNIPKKNKSLYEFYILEDNILIETFRADCEDFRDLARGEAERYMTYLKNKSPGKSYRLEDNSKTRDYFY